MHPKIQKSIDDKIQEIVEDGSGWGRVCIVLERGKIVCVEKTDSDKVRETSCK